MTKSYDLSSTKKLGVEYFKTVIQHFFVVPDVQYPVYLFDSNKTDCE